MNHFEETTSASADEMALAQMLHLLDDKGNSLIPNYMNILINRGLPRTRNPKKVLVIGAGIAGLVTASLLKNAGHQVQIIEANGNRIGGRLKTIRKEGNKQPFKDPKQYAEAGAMRIPSHHVLTLALIDKLNLPRRLFYLADIDPNTGNQELPNPPVVVRHPWDGRELMRLGPDNPRFQPPQKRYWTFMNVNGIQERRGDYNRSPERLNRGFPMPRGRLGFTAEQQLNHSLDVIRNYYSEIRGGKRVNKQPLLSWLAGWAQVIRELDEYSMRHFLVERAKLDEGTLTAIGTIENLTARGPLSFIHSFLGRADLNTDVTYWEIVGGSWRLPYAFMPELENDIVCNRRMTHLEFYHPHTARHTSDQAGQRVSIRTISEPLAKTGQGGEDEFEHEEFKGDCAVVTVPFSSLRFVSVTPGFSYPKRRAIIELHYDAATKVLLEFNRRWWEFSEDDWREALGDRYKLYSQGDQETKREPFFGGGSMSDSPNRFMYYPSHKIEGSEGGVLLASYTWADDARRWDSMPDGERYRFALKNLIKIHGERIREFWVEGGQTESWARNFYAFGEAAVFTPGQMRHLHVATQSIEGPVHFAGEHTSLKHAWIEGSIESAIRAAIEVNEN